jgi:single-strand DNA-binding protein
MNNVCISGNLCNDPEVKQTDTFTVCKFRIANNDGGKKDEPVFIQVECWDKTADFVSQWFKKGKSIEVVGKLCQDNWQDKEGNNRSAYKIKALNVGFYGKKGDDQAPAKREAAPAPAQEQDIPF